MMLQSAAGALAVCSLLGLYLGGARILLVSRGYPGSPALWLAAGAASAALAALSVLAGMLKRRRSVTRPADAAVAAPARGRPLVHAAVIFAFAAILLSDVVGANFGFYIDRSSRWDVLYLGAAGFAWLQLVAGKKLNRLFGIPSLLLFLGMLIAAFVNYADGRLIFSDDHPSFMYRLQLLREHFPQIPFYNPDWNGGYSAREFLPSGMINAFLLGLPFFALGADFTTFQGAAVYSLMLPYFFIAIVPLSMFAAVRVAGGSRAAAVIGALLATAPTMGFFEWMLKYGTIGFAISAGLTPLTIALAVKLAWSQPVCRWACVWALLAVSLLTLTWSLALLSLLPVLFLALICWRRTFAIERRRRVATFALLFCLLNGPWMYLFVRESKVFSFVAGSTLPGVEVSEQNWSPDAHAPASVTAGGQLAEAATETYRDFHQLLIKVNPLLFLTFVPGIFFLKGRGQQAVFIATIFWLLLLAALGEEIKPQLELRRMIIPASFLMCIPSAIYLSSLLRALSTWGDSGAALSRQPWRKVAGAGATMLMLGGILITPLTAGAAYLNRSDERFVFAPDYVAELAQAIAEHGGSGRTFFLGFILQELGATWWGAQDGGHVAALPMLTGKPMYASDYYHRRWTTIDPIPPEFRARGGEGIEQFLDLVHATSVVTFKREWADYALHRPNYRQVFQGDRFRLFVRTPAPGTDYFYRGSGRVEQTGSSIVVYPATAEVVVKFRHLPGLKAKAAAAHDAQPPDVQPPPIEIFPVHVFDEEVGGGKREPYSFIGLRLPPQYIGQAITISY